jgi:hypothetical protein
MNKIKLLLSLGVMYCGTMLDGSAEATDGAAYEEDYEEEGGRRPGWFSTQLQRISNGILLARHAYGFDSLEVMQWHIEQLKAAWWPINVPCLEAYESDFARLVKLPGNNIDAICTEFDWVLNYGSFVPDELSSLFPSYKPTRHPLYTRAIEAVQNEMGPARRTGNRNRHQYLIQIFERMLHSVRKSPFQLAVVFGALFHSKATIHEMSSVFLSDMNRLQQQILRRVSNTEEESLLKIVRSGYSDWPSEHLEHLERFAQNSLLCNTIAYERILDLLIKGFDNESILAAYIKHIENFHEAIENGNDSETIQRLYLFILSRFRICWNGLYGSNVHWRERMALTHKGFLRKLRNSSCNNEAMYIVYMHELIEMLKYFLQEGVDELNELEAASSGEPKMYKLYIKTLRSVCIYVTSMEFFNCDLEREIQALRERAFAGDRDAAKMYVETVGVMLSAKPGTRARKIRDDEVLLLRVVSSGPERVRYLFCDENPPVSLPEVGDADNPEKRQHAQELLTEIMTHKYRHFTLLRF